MNQAREDINCEEVCSIGIMGRGVDVAVFDTGIYLHGDFKDRVTAFADLINHHISPYDDNGYGTHIVVTIGGNGISSDGKYRGVAPGCSLISVKVLDQKGNGYATDVSIELKWIRESRDKYNIRIASVPVGSLSRRDMIENSALMQGVNMAWDDGLVVVVAVGNHGPGRMTIIAPGTNREAITMGCSSDRKEVDIMGGRTVDYSGRGPTLACVRKPDLVAPGLCITSCCNEPGKCFPKSGTSMSMPLVLSVIALLLEKHPDMGNKDVKLRIRERALNLGLPHSQQGWGKPDVGRLLGQNYKQRRSPGRQRNKPILPMQYPRGNYIGSFLYGQGKPITANADNYVNATSGHLVLKQLCGSVKEGAVKARGTPMESSTVTPVPCWELLVP